MADRCLGSELAREKMWARIHLIPMLQAEEDRDQVRRYWADQERERVLLGKNTRVYHSDRYVLDDIFLGGGEGFAGMEALSVGMEIGSGDVEEVGV